LSGTKFVIWAPSFEDTTGGIIALHLLCQRLNEAGETAMLWPAGKRPLDARSSLREIASAARWELEKKKRGPYSTGPFANPIAERKDLAGAIVVYPEIVQGNPLRSDRVARWLLHKPGYHTGRTDFGQRDLFFHYQDAFQDPRFGADASNKLSLTWLNEAYRHWNTGERAGSAYLLRKGKGRKIVHDLEGSISIDQLTHEEKAQVFNERKYFISYDLYTLYNLYALICGCLPIVVPDENVSKEEWLADEGDRYGIAYGFDDVDRAMATREKMLERIERIRAGEDAMLRSFVSKCREAFG
jgi:hypothetical protein